MERLFSSKKVCKSRQDIRGYTCGTCSQYCSVTCGGTCAVACGGTCTGSCKTGCSYSCGFNCVGAGFSYN